MASAESASETTSSGLSPTPIVKALCDWSEISALCAKLSGLLDRHDRDRFAYLLRYG